MENVKREAPSLLLVILELIAGILLLINPQFFTRLVIILIGVALLIIGIVYLVQYIKDRNYPSENPGRKLATALLCLVPGIICTFLSKWVMGLFAVAAVIFGIIMIISGIFKIQAYSENKKQGIQASGLKLAGAIVTIILGIIIIFNPFGAVNTLWIFVGIALLIAGLLDLIALINSRKYTG